MSKKKTLKEAREEARKKREDEEARKKRKEKEARKKRKEKEEEDGFEPFDLTWWSMFG